MRQAGGYGHPPNAPPSPAPLQIAFAALMHSMVLRIKLDPCEAEKAFALPLISVEDYARRVLGYA